MIYDISMDIYYDMQVYKNRKEKRPLVKVMEDYSSSTVYESRIDMDLHTGTHVDAPLHMLENGSKVDALKPERLVTRCRVLNMCAVEDRIEKADLEGKAIKSGEFILLKTKNSFSEDLSGNFVFLAESGAEYLKSKGISGVGIDALGIERDQPGHPSHKQLLGNGVIILEGLRLAEVQEGEYVLLAVPLKIKDAEASPVRALLLDKEAVSQLI